MRTGPDFLVESGIGLIPQSMTTAPGFTQDALTSAPLPTAATMTSAFLHTSSRFCVLE